MNKALLLVVIISVSLTIALAQEPSRPEQSVDPIQPVEPVSLTQTHRIRWTSERCSCGHSLGMPSMRGHCSPSSPAPLLVPEVVEHPAGISRRLKTQEVLMKALIFRDTGEPKSVLKLAEIPTPPLAPGEALVRVLLSPINPSDLHMVRGRYGYQPELPASQALKAWGIVEAVGPGVQDPTVGTRVV